jgi:dihydroflavonol-4-reductase
MAKYKMYFSSAKAAHELSYRSRPAVEALGDAYRWFRDAGYLK